MSNNSVQNILNVHQILELILTQLHTTDLRTARLVCRNWAGIGGSLLGKRTRLSVSKLFHWDGSKLCLTPVSAHLMRRISISDSSPSIPTRKKSSIVTKVFKDLAQMLQFTREVDFHVADRRSQNAFIAGLRKVKNPATSIQHVSLSVVNNYRSKPCVPPIYTKKLAVLANLTSITFSFCGYIIQDSTHGFHGFQPFLQILIDSAPKLTSLKASSPFYPSLDGCKNLKVIRLENFNPSKNPCVDLVAAIKMLAQVKNSLVQIELSAADGDTKIDISQVDRTQMREKQYLLGLLV